MIATYFASLTTENKVVLSAIFSADTSVQGSVRGTLNLDFSTIQEYHTLSNYRINVSGSIPERAH